MRAAASNSLKRSGFRQGQRIAPFAGSSLVPVPKQSVQTSEVLVWRSSPSSITLVPEGLNLKLLRSTLAVKVNLNIPYNTLAVTDDHVLLKELRKTYMNLWQSLLRKLGLNSHGAE